MSLPRYPEYKDSGVAWLGNVPSHWGIKKLGYELLEPPCYGVLVPDFEAGGVPMIRIMDMQHGKVVREELTTISPELSNQYTRTLTQRGDVLLSVVGTIGEVVHVDDHLAGVNLSRAVARLQPNEAVLNRRFLGWLFQSTVFETYVDLICVGSAQRVLNMGDLSSLRVGFPPIAEQTAIATFLDRETAKIDALIAEQEKLIALLAEKRQATISHAVTRGLNPDAPMKDSGVAWLGEVPAHWDVRRLRHVVSAVQTGGTPTSETPENDVEGGLDWYTPGDFDSQFVLGNSNKRVSNTVAASGEVRVFSPGSILIVSIGATLGKVGLTDRPASANQQINALAIPDTQNGRFFAYSLSVKSEVMRFLSNASTIGIMNQEKTKEIVVAVPPLVEQNEIAIFLDNEISKIANLVAESEHTTSLLKERRSVLIAAAVTGQIDVRSAAHAEA